LRDLTQHLTTRADDNHAPPVSLSSPHRQGPPLSWALRGCQALVRFCALRRIKPHAPLLVRAPVNSFEFQPCGRTPQAGYFVRSLRHGGHPPPTPSTHRLRLGLPGYLIPFAPLALAPQRQVQSREPPSPLVFFPISTHFTAPPGIPLPSPALKPGRPWRIPRVEPVPFTPDLPSRLHALYAQSFRTTLAPYVLPRLLARS
jgi:hypothetical protein